MGFVDAVKSFYRRYVDFEGRSSRSEYWWSQLFLMLLYIPLLLAMAIGENMEILALLILGIVSLVYLASFIPTIAVLIRRLHDQDKTGWWALLAFVPIASLVILVFMCLPGTRGENKYGLDPLGAGGRIGGDTGGSDIFN